MSDVCEEMSQRVCEHYTLDDVREELRRQVGAMGLMAWCRKHGFEHHSAISEMLHHKRDLTIEVIVACGFFRIEPPTFFIKHEG